MDERTAELEAAVRARDALIAEAQGLLTRYLAKKISPWCLSITCSSYSKDRGNAGRSGSRVKLGEDFRNNAWR